MIGRVTLAMLALMAVLHLPLQAARAQEKFDLEKAITTAKTPADHEAIASYYERAVATAQAQVEEHRRLAESYRRIAGSKGPLPMEGHCQHLAQSDESIASDSAALAAAHRQMAQEALQK